MDDPIIFDTFKEIYDSLDLDDEDWVNKEARTLFLKTKHYKNVEPQLTYVPSFLNEKSFKCPSGHKFKPKWLDKCHPLPSLRLRDGRLYKAASVETSCTVCGEATRIQFPDRQFSMDAHIYGDEAIKDELDGKVVISYSFISKPRRADIHEIVEREFLRLKAALAPSVSPKDWVLHFTELNNGRKRAEIPYLAHLKQQDVLKFARRLGRLISKFPKQLNKWNCTSVFIKPEVWKGKVIKDYKSLVFYPLVIKVVDNITSSNLAPVIHFERTGDDGWATNRVTEGKCTLMWPFLTGGIPASNPIFEEPSESIYYELADFMSFVIGRYLYVVGKRAAGDKVPFDYKTDWLGDVMYMGAKGDGTIIMEEGRKFPLGRFFNGTKWATI